MMSSLVGRQALVIGAGMSGLTTAGALAKHFEQVTVLERDGLADDLSHRRGTPQSRQLHGLLSGGLEALCRTFPGFDQDLAAAGAAPIGVAADICEELPGFDPFPRRDFGKVLYGMSRPLLERTVRRRVRAHRNVAIRDRCRALALVASADGRRIAGARCEGIDGLRETVSADLVVDASARGILTLAALDAMGRTPRQTSVGVSIGYSTAAFEIPEQRPDWEAVLTFPAAPGERHCGFLLPVEGNRWMVCIGEQQCPAPPVDITGFLEAARRLRTRTIHDAVRNARPAGAPQRLVFPQSSWRHYETVVDFPQGLIPVGDAICRFNPVYGQGMSVAAREANILADLLAQRANNAEGLAGLPQDFLAEAEPWIAGAWSMSAIPDLAYPQARGERPADLEHTLDFVSALNRVAARDRDVHELLVAVRHLARPIGALHEPGLVDRVQVEMAAASPRATAGSATVAA